MRDLINIVENEYGSSYDATNPIISKYNEGHCYALALAHHRMFGWPLCVVGADENDYALDGKINFFHGMVMHPSGVLLDISGSHDPTAFTEEWGEPILPLKNETELLSNLNPHMKSITLNGLKEAKKVIKEYLIPKYPELYETSSISEALSYDELNNDEAHQLQLRTAYKDAMRLFNTVTISKFNWKLGKAKIIVERKHHKQGAQRLFIVNEDKECLGSINITTIDNHDLRVNFSIVFEEYRNMNLAYYAYKSLLDSGYAISSDIHLSKAAVSLWKKLWNDPSLVRGVYEFQFNAPPLYIGSDDFDSVFEDRSRFIKVEKR